MNTARISLASTACTAACLDASIGVACVVGTYGEEFGRRYTGEDLRLYQLAYDAAYAAARTLRPRHEVLDVAIAAIKE